MRTLTHPHFTGIGLLSITAIALTFVAWQTRDKLPTALPFAGVELSRPSDMPHIATRLPFTFEDVVKYFQDSLAQPPQEKHFNDVLFRGGNGSEHFFAIAISRNGPDLLLKFQVVDDYGMNIVREFFEAPFIQWKESEQLYALLSPGSGIRTISLSRFDVVFECEHRAETTFINLMFSPRSRNISYPADPN